MQARYVSAPDLSEPALVRRAKRLFEQDLGTIALERLNPLTDTREFEGQVTLDYEFNLRVSWKHPISQPEVVFFDVQAEADLDIPLLKGLVADLAQQHFGDTVLVYHSAGRARNLAAFPRLLDFENVLRELITCVMSRSHGAEWWHQVNQQIQDEAERNKQNRMSNRLHDYVELHPVYYVDLRRLREIIEGEDTQSGVFSRIFNNYDQVNMPAKISEIRDLRNRVMHGDYLTVGNLENIRVICSQFDRFLVAPHHVGDFEDRDLNG